MRIALYIYDRVFSLAEYRSCNVDCCFGGYVPVFPFMPVYQISVSLSDCFDLKPLASYR